jgi:hypothetical protein
MFAFEDDHFLVTAAWRLRVRRLVFLIAAGSAWEWWKLMRGTKRIVLHESEFIPSRGWSQAAPK